ncbi:glycosyl hydrolase family 28 protein [Enterococcus asini]|uniref:glycosyl hydrolase family 28 protein n=1 Tax=Enterococcus asini TaxID=57732 RepID=UPI00266D0EE8|nr:glycosyl hydrolase family 28 protein [Enterococcus asini]
MKPYLILNLQVAPATVGSDSLTLIWDKPIKYSVISYYYIYQNQKLVARRPVNKTHITLSGLKPDTNYQFEVLATDGEGNAFLESSARIEASTQMLGAVIDVTAPPYSADGTGTRKATELLQKAIFECPENGVILIPKEAKIVTGALDLKSNMTLQVDGKLIASLDPADYVIHETDKWFEGSVNQDGLPLSRYEGWELHCYRSLINVGFIDPKNRTRVVCENVRICGQGEIYGGGNVLGLAMREIYSDVDKYPEYYSDKRPGRRVRGRLICMMQAKNVHLTGVTVSNPSCWTIHMIYCDTITTHGITIQSKGIDNGDGWDPDSSKNMLIFDTTFDTGDDCIAIKSGKNPEGNKINIPTENVRIFDLEMLGGHGMAIGSEQSGGVDGVSLRDCRIHNTLYGLELKAHNDRGGYIKNIHVEDCELDRFMAHSVDYNADGQPAESLPIFSNINLNNITISGKERGIELIGFTEGQRKAAYIQNVLIENVRLKFKENDILLEKCQDVAFKNVRLSDGNRPNYMIDEDTVRRILIEG